MQFFGRKSVNGSDTDPLYIGTSLKPFKTIQNAINKLGVNGGTITIKQSTGPAEQNINIANIAGDIALIGDSTKEKTQIQNLNITATSGVINLENIQVEDIICNTSATLTNCIITKSATYTPNATTTINYNQVDHTKATHTFIHNTTDANASGFWNESADCKGPTLSIPKVLESVITTSTTPPALKTEGDRYLILGTGTEDWLNKSQVIASWINSDSGYKWDYQPLTDENIVTTQDLTPLSYIYIGGTWTQITPWVLKTKEADSISAGLMSVTDYEKLLYSSTVTNIKNSNNLKEERLTYNPATKFYEITYSIKFSQILIVPEELPDPYKMTSVNSLYDGGDFGLVDGNIVVTLPDPRSSETKASFNYDGDRFTRNAITPDKTIIN